MNRENLEKLASYLESLPTGYKHFGMKTFVEQGGMSFEQADRSPMAGDCGTVACAVGHGPAAGIPPLPIDGDADCWGEDWFEYSDRVFGLNDPEWTWCFSGSWQMIDNTHHGAAKRIRHMLAHGVPDDGVAQSFGDAPYMFERAGL